MDRVAIKLFCFFIKNYWFAFLFIVTIEGDKKIKKEKMVFLKITFLDENECGKVHFTFTFTLLLLFSTKENGGNDEAILD